MTFESFMKFSTLILMGVILLHNVYVLAWRSRKTEMTQDENITTLAYLAFAAVMATTIWNGNPIVFSSAVLIFSVYLLLISGNVLIHFDKTMSEMLTMIEEHPAYIWRNGSINVINGKTEQTYSVTKDGRMLVTRRTDNGPIQILDSYVLTRNPFKADVIRNLMKRKFVKKVAEIVSAGKEKDK